MNAIPVQPGWAPGGRVRTDKAEPVWCICRWGRRCLLVHTIADRYVRTHGYAPTVRDLMRSTGLSMHPIRGTVDRLERAGLVERRRRNARALRVIQGGRS